MLPGGLLPPLVRGLLTVTRSPSPGDCHRFWAANCCQGTVTSFGQWTVARGLSPRNCRHGTVARGLLPPLVREPSKGHCCQVNSPRGWLPPLVRKLSPGDCRQVTIARGLSLEDSYLLCSGDCRQGTVTISGQQTVSRGTVVCSHSNGRRHQKSNYESIIDY